MFATTGLDALTRGLGKVRTETEAIGRAQVAARRASPRAGVSPEVQAARDKAKAEAAAAKAARESGKATEKAAKEAAKAVEKAEKAKTKALKEEAKIRLKEEIAQGKLLADIASKNAKSAHKAQMAEARANARDITRWHATMRREARSEARTAERERRQSMSRFGGMASMGLAVAGAGLAAGAAAVGVVGHRQMALEDQAARLSINGRKTGQAGVAPILLQTEAEDVAKSVGGVKTSDVLSAMSSYVGKTGDLASARKFAKTFATTSLASGASMDDVAAASASLQQKFGISSEEELQNALAGLLAGGKAGEFELKDLAAQLPRMGAAAQRFGFDKSAKGIAELGGLAQIARMSTGSSEEASTGLQAALRQLIAKGADNGKHGIKALTGASVFTDSSNQQTRNIQDVLVDVIAGMRGDAGKAQAIFGDEGVKGVSTLISTYNEASKALGKGATEAEKRAAGEKALREILAQNMSTQSSWAEVTRDAATAASTASAKMTTAGETILSSLGKAIQPAMTGLVQNIQVITVPASLAAKALGVLMEAFMETGKVLKDFLGVDLSGSGNSSIDKAKKRAGESGKTEQEEIQRQLIFNDQEYASLVQDEKTYGSLSPEKQLRKYELERDRPELLKQFSPEMTGKYGEDTKAYEDYYKRNPNGPMIQPSFATTVETSRTYRDLIYDMFLGSPEGIGRGDESPEEKQRYSEEKKRLAAQSEVEQVSMGVDESERVKGNMSAAEKSSAVIKRNLESVGSPSSPTAPGQPNRGPNYIR